MLITFCFLFFSPCNDSFLQLFLNHPVLDPKAMKLKWGKIDEEALLEFLVEEKGFDLERTQKQIARLVKAKAGATQKRMDSFFTRKPSSQNATNKRRLDAKKKKGGSKKKARTGGGKKR